MTYWDALYRRGGTSGAGSVGALRAWKWQVLEKSGADLQHVIDVGCGDLSFWEGRRCADYLGIEQSADRCQRNKAERPDLRCLPIDAAGYLPLLPQAPTVMCFDMLFHIMNPTDYISILRNISRYSSDYVFVYTWARNPFAEPLMRVKAAAVQARRRHWGNVRELLIDHPVTDGEYQYYRNFPAVQKYIEHHRCVDVQCPPESVDPYGAMWVFRRREWR